MAFKFEQPPERLTWYHLGQLLDAEDGGIQYDKQQYPVHGISNNAVACIWCGLLVDSPDGVVLTDLGRRVLADWRNSPEGRAWAAEWAAVEEDVAPDATAATPTPSAAEPALEPAQLGLFGEVA